MLTTIQVIDQINEATLGSPDNAYRQYDYECDIEIANKYSNQCSQFIYHLRPAGSMLFPLQCGMNNVLITSYFFDSEAKYFLITNSNYEELTHGRVTELSAKTPSLPASTERLLEKVDQLLNDGNVTFGGISAAPKTPTTPSHWQDWIEWFSKTTNEQMRQCLIQATAQLKRA
ncbi:hypothetical protein [Vibrio agarivorans]|uniref:Uncharacterized protein n=1 Tax=Vibrio agarivorans TaxID=153622 RepID=A0ABT7Y7B2_9VIBR|nr:hypothetical protein [Vibrio agarivorans]MDN2483887.1 hypothetical protein [Vibrio agarivorans]